MTYPILWHPGAGFDVQIESGATAPPINLGSEGVINHRLAMSRSSEVADLNSAPVRRVRNTSTSVRRKELARHSGIGSNDNQEALRSSRSGNFSSDVEIVEPVASSLGSSARVPEAGHEGNGGCESDRFNVRFIFLSFS